MRRKERAIKNPAEIRQILEQARVLRIAFNNGIYPYILPVNFGFNMDGQRLTLFFHGAKEGEKHQIISADPHVTFEADCSHQLIPPAGAEACTASFAYRSIIGQGLISPAKEEEKELLLRELLCHYGIAAKTFSPSVLARTAVYKIEAVSYTAKGREAAL